MKNSKQNLNRKNQLSSNSNLFLQLGIILSLVIVYNIIELKISKEIFNPQKPTSANMEPEVYNFPQFQIELKVLAKKDRKVPVPKQLIDFTIADNSPDSKPENFLQATPQQKINLDSLFSNLPKDDFEEGEIIPFMLIEQAPRFPGCTGKTEEDFKLCFNKKMLKFVTKKFNPTGISKTNIQGKQKIYVQFQINENGDIVHIQARSPFTQLEKEAIRVIGELPKMIPGKQRNKNVGVRYNLPIVFHME